jgi:hypothetical protein
MDYSKLKIIFCVAVCLTMLSAPFTLEFTPDGKAFAMGSRGGGNGGSQQRKAPPRKTKWENYKPLTTEINGGHQEPNAIHPVPEPATMLLVGGGLAGLAIFRKKFKK